MNRSEFATLLDQTGLKLTEAQKDVLFQAYPKFQALIAKATPPMPLEAEPSVTFNPEVK
jgi:hypothetical protein